MKIGKSIKKLLNWVVLLIVLAFVYKHNPYQFEFLGHYDKIWAHRVNTLDKLAWATPFFKGVELDVVYTDGVLDITHPPKPSIDLTLQTYLKQLDAQDSIKLWLDIKNLRPTTANQIFDRIESLLVATGYPKSLLLVESRSPEALKVFIENQYRCSYYLPEGLHYMEPTQLDSTVAAVQEVIADYPKLEISSHFKDYPLMAKNFSASKNVWVIRHSRFKDYRAIRTLLSDTSVKTVLIPYKSVRGNNR